MPERGRGMIAPGAIKPHAAYRPDIDGLRAFAVGSVVLYHAFPRYVRTGFIGVDVFFVISGFLITSIILADIEAEKFSFRTFYVRRINRIFPALIVVMLAALTVGWFVLFPDEYKALGKHVEAGAGFASNFVLWSEAGYFDAASNTKILLHLWSLGIEEQYYLLWPLVVWAARKANFNMLTLSALLLGASFAANIQTAGVDHVAAFYSPGCRFWELFAGGALAYLSIWRPAILSRLETRASALLDPIIFRPGFANAGSSSVRDVAAVAGVALLVCAERLIPKDADFPGWCALLPVGGAYLLIFAGPRAAINRFVFANPVLVWIGLISYPLYLWHWPLLAFARIFSDGPVPNFVLWAIVLASVILAVATYRLIERPIRFGARRARSAVVLFAAMAALFGVGLAISRSDGLMFRLGERADYLSYFNPYGKAQVEEREEISQNRCNRYRYDQGYADYRPRESIDPSCYTATTPTSVLIWGDSEAAHFYYGLRKELPSDISVLLLFGSGCQPRPINMANLQIDSCEMQNYFALERSRANPPDVVLLGSNNSYHLDYIRELAHTLKGFGVKKVIVTSEVPHWSQFLYKLVARYFWTDTPERILGHQEHEMLDLDRDFRAGLKPDEEFEFIDLLDFFCNARGCLTYLDGNRREGLMTFDGSHLRPLASDYLAKNLLAPKIMKALGR